MTMTMNEKINKVEDLLCKTSNALDELSEVNEKFDDYRSQLVEIFENFCEESDYEYNKIVVENKTIHSEISGIVEFGKDIIDGKRVLVVSKDESEIVEYYIPYENENRLLFKEGDEINLGDVLIYKNPIMQKESA